MPSAGHQINLRDLPAYTYTEASKALGGIPPTTLRAWTKGQQGFEPVFRAAGSRLSYFNLVEAQVLRAIRVKGRLPLPQVRAALDTARASHDIDRLLIHQDFRFGAVGLFVERFSQLISLSKSGQIAIRELIEGHLDRVEYGPDGYPSLFYPHVQHRDATMNGAKIIRIDPMVSFGRPTVATRAVSTQSIVSRINAGEAIPFIAEDYRIGREEVEEAIHYEAA